MKANYTHISFLLDNSGSMGGTEDDVIGGYNSFVEEQKKQPGDLTLSLVKFGSEYEMIYSFRNARTLEALTRKDYHANGYSTKLIDSAARLIIETGRDLAEMHENERPSKVLFVITTDGQENASTEYTNKQLTDLIDQQKINYKWEFAFLGADQDAFAEAGKIGIKTNSVNFNKSKDGIGKMFRAFTASASSYRNAEADSYSLTQKDIDNA